MNIPFVSPFEIQFIIGAILSVVSGVVIGIERESRKKDAGISTHSFVIIGAMLLSMISSVVDPASTSRIASSIVTGVGFLGAGLILKNGSKVHNLTTAASVWFAASIGIAYGFGFYSIGIVATIASVFIPRIPHISERNSDSQ